MARLIVLIRIAVKVVARALARLRSVGGRMPHLLIVRGFELGGTAETAPSSGHLRISRVYSFTIRISRAPDFNL
jgi:hypothetical protein